MALFDINPSSIGQAIATTAGAKAAQAVAQSMSPKLVQDVQKVLSVGSTIGKVLGVSTGLEAIDGLLGWGGGTESPSPLLGGLSLSQAKAIYEQVKAARVARKNLFFLRIQDDNLPSGDYQSADGTPSSLGGLISSCIGPPIGAASAGVANAVGSIAGQGAANFTSGLINGALGAVGLGGFTAGNSIGAIATNTFDLLAMDVSYGSGVEGDHVQIGSAFIDRPTGSVPHEVQVTTMDDEAGSLKRWFDGKRAQVNHRDGTFGLPSEYLVTIEIVHAIPSDQVEGWRTAYSKKTLMRAASMQHELSRRDQGIAEVQMTFAPFDSFHPIPG